MPGILIPSAVLLLPMLFWRSGLGVVVVAFSFTTGIFARASHTSYDYDLIIIGAGASGLFASGAATLLGGAGQKTCLIDHGRTTGGDCTNAACVPSKSFRAKVSTLQQQQQEPSLSSPRAATTNNVRAIREYIRETVEIVRAREDLGRRRPNNLDLLLVQSCHFVGPREVQVVVREDQNNDDKDPSCAVAPTITRRLTAKKFLIATGADPVVPPALERAARRAAIPWATYRTFLNPDSSGEEDDTEFWNVLESSTRRKRRRILVVGGGATACELIQSLASMNSRDLEIVWVAPSILPDEDVILQQAAYDLLVATTNRTTNDTTTTSATTTFHLGRLVDIQIDGRPVIQSARDNRTIVTLEEPVDAMLLCIGRVAATRELDLSVAGVDVDGRGRILVRSDLRSTSNRHVFAAGDCCSAILPRHRSASQAAWTGFHAVRNLKVPPLLRPGGTSVARSIPRIVYTRCVLYMDMSLGRQRSHQQN
jgi:pyruvate/2-oxoglutarate dehydrogenase complex dihydrolipoamide dehydrogenase (E3) component